jgi:hypothetical protein
MKTNLHFLLMLVVACASIARAQTNADPMANYQVILDRLPFGLVAAGKGGHGALGFGRYAFIGLVSPDGTSSNRVAVIHDRQTNYYYFKAEGEQIDDVKVMRLENAGTGRKLLLQRGADIMTLTYAEEVHQGGTQLNPFGPPPAIVVPGVPTIADTKAAAREKYEAFKREKESGNKKNDAAHRNNESSNRKKEFQPKNRFKR